MEYRYTLESKAQATVNMDVQDFKTMINIVEYYITNNEDNWEAKELLGELKSARKSMVSACAYYFKRLEQE